MVDSLAAGECEERPWRSGGVGRAPVDKSWVRGLVPPQVLKVDIQKVQVGSPCGQQDSLIEWSFFGEG